MDQTTRERLLEVDSVDAGDIAAIDRAAAANDAAARIDRQLAEAAPHRRGAESISVRWLAEFDGHERLLEYEESHKWTGGDRNGSTCCSRRERQAVDTRRPCSRLTSAWPT